MSIETKTKLYEEWIEKVDSRLAHLINYYEACDHYEMCAILMEYKSTLRIRLIDQHLIDSPDGF